MKYKVYALLGFVCVCLFVFMFVSVFFIYFSGPNASSQHLQYFGQVGDFFGGMLNPILAFASFIALLYTIKLQSNEMELTRTEMSLSRLEQSKAAEAATGQLQQDKNLEEYRNINQLLSIQLKKVDELFNSRVDGTLVDAIKSFLIAERIQCNRNTHGQIVEKLKRHDPFMLKTSHAYNISNEVIFLKTLLLRLKDASHMLKLDSEGSYTDLIGTKVAEYCAIASFLEFGKDIIKVSDNVLQKKIKDWFAELHVNADELFVQTQS